MIPEPLHAAYRAYHFARQMSVAVLVVGLVAISVGVGVLVGIEAQEPAVCIAAEVSP